MRAEDLLVQRIEHAWQDACPPRPGCISKPTYDDEGISAYFAGRAWRGHSAEQLRALDFAPGILTDEAFVYFLPAYMIADIRSPMEADTIVEALLLNLSPGRGRAIASLLTESQREAVANYVQFVWEREGDLYAEWCADAMRGLNGGPRNA